MPISDAGMAPDPMCIDVAVRERSARAEGGSERYLNDLVHWLAEAGMPANVRNPRAWPEPRLRRSHLDGSFPPDGEVRTTTVSQAPRILLSALPLPGTTHYQPHAGLYRSAFEAEREAMAPGLRKSLYRLGNRLNVRRSWLVREQDRLLGRNPPPRVMTFSAALRQEIVREYGFPPEYIVCAYPGVDLGRFRPAEEEDSRHWSARRPRVRMLFVAHNFLLKGLHCLLIALAKAVRSGLDAELLVIGDGRPAEYQRLARRLGIGAVVRFVGQVDDRRLEQLYRRCDVLVHPTFFDPCSLVVFEALASGCPVITTSRNGAAELMVSGRHGYVLENPGNVDALADALLRTADPEELDRMRTAVKALRPRLAFEGHARRVLEWLRSVS